MAFESTPERQAIRDRLVDAFAEVSIQGVITHQQIAAIIGKRTSSPDAIKFAAFKIAAEDHGAVFENIRGTGYRRIAAGEVHRVGSAARVSIRGKAKRGVKKIAAVLASNSNSMTSQDRVKAHAEIGLLGMIRMAAGRGAANRAHAAAEAAQEKRQKPPTQEAIAQAVLRVARGEAA